ncbi:MAG: tRNA (adenosine(37)-N6)-threonylcarbamoyltransferase complex ATPase subunit type 1 TsaE [Flavobacteriaceae bacterium]|nr:tRNA (adenosine(37)-N6)-threonylcarbamoyltransferase complex ATPase subunit type 1 TsaE [Flavobacteriaceae bacterium]
MLLSYSEKNLPGIAQQLLENIASKIWLFYGDMGCGKTTLIKHLVQKLGVTDVANSPTFSLVNEYLSQKGESIYHFDFYRIKNEIEALDIGIDDYFYADNYCFIEWPEKIENLLPLNAVAIHITVNADGSRNLTFKT